MSFDRKPNQIKPKTKWSNEKAIENKLFHQCITNIEKRPPTDFDIVFRSSLILKLVARAIQCRL